MFVCNSRIRQAALFGAISLIALQIFPQIVAAQSDSKAAPVQTVRIPAGTTVQLEFTEKLSSATSITGQTFGLRLREPVMLDGQVVIPAGALGGGEVIDVSRAGIGGRSGKLILSGRYLEFQGQRVRIRGLQSVLAGKDRSRAVVNTAILVPQVALLGTFIPGGEIEVASGTVATAHLAADLVVTAPAQTAQTDTQAKAEPHSPNPER